MAIEERSGADGTYISLGRQTARGARLSANNMMIPKRFLVSAIDIDEDVDIEESNIISAIGADVPSEQGQYSISGSLTTRVYAEDFWHLLRGILVPVASSFTSVALTGEVALASTNGNPSGALTLTKTMPQANVGSEPKFDWSSQLQLVLTGSPTLASDASMDIVGYRRGGRPNADRFFQRESVALTSSGGISTKFWQEVTSVNINGVTGASTHSLNWVPDTHRTRLSFQATNPQFLGWTALIVKAGYPAVAEDLIPSTMNLRFGQGTSDVQMDVVGSRIDHERTIAGGEDRQVALSQTDLDYFKLPANNVTYPSWAGAMSFGDQIVKYTDIEVGVNRNLQANPGFDASRFKRGFSATRNRQITFVPTTLFTTGDEASDVFTNWQELFRNDERQKLSFLMYAFDPSGRTYRINVNTPSGQITESPRIEVAGPGPVNRRIPFKALPTAEGTSEINFEIFTKVAYSEN